MSGTPALELKEKKKINIPVMKDNQMDDQLLSWSRTSTGTQILPSWIS